MRTTSWATRLVRAHRGVRAAGDAGVTLVEVIVAAVLLMILSTSVLGLILQSQRSQVDNRSRVTAASLAAREIDIVRQVFGATDEGPRTIADAGLVTNPNPLDGGTPGDPLVVDGQAYTLVRNAAWDLTERTGASPCEGGTLVQYPTLTVTVTVTWENMGSTKPVISKATLAPDKGDGAPETAGFVAVAVEGSDGLPSAGRTVRVSGGSENHAVQTDASGCAVIGVTPAASGTTYDVTMDDAGFVDMGGNPNPTKTTGVLEQGELNNEIGFTYDRAGTVRVILVDENDVPVAPLPGSTVTLVASQYSGTTPEKVYPLTGSETAISGLWPTTYGGYVGAVEPMGGYPSVALPPGGDVELRVPQQIAQLPLENLPAGTSQIVAVPVGQGTCSSPLATAVAASAPTSAITLTPGTWDLFAIGSTFSCSPGPAGLPVADGENEGLVWGRGSITVQGGPPGSLWAVDAALSGPLSTCPTGATAALAQDVTGARNGQAQLPAGTYYLYVTDGAADGTCVAFPVGGINPAAAPYGAVNSLTWAPPTTKVSITGVERIASGVYWTVVLSSAAPPNGLTCSQTTLSPTAGTVQLGAATSTSQTLIAQVAPGTWYVYGWDKRTGVTGARCRHAGTVNVGWASSAMTIDFDLASPRVVGP